MCIFMPATVAQHNNITVTAIDSDRKWLSRADSWQRQQKVNFYTSHYFNTLNFELLSYPSPQLVVSFFNLPYYCVGERLIVLSIDCLTAH